MDINGGAGTSLLGPNSFLFMDFSANFFPNNMLVHYPVGNPGSASDPLKRYKDRPREVLFGSNGPSSY